MCNINSTNFFSKKNQIGFVNNETHDDKNNKIIHVNNIKSILVVDDNPIYTKIIHKYLSKLGNSVICLNNGKKAIEAIKFFDFDLILCDIHMPVMDGIEFCILANELPKKPNIIILYSDSEIIYFPTDINFDYYINKRLTPKEIEDFILEFL